MANAIHSKKSKLEINTSTTQTPTWVQIKGLKSFSGLGGGSPAVIDSTDLDSEAKEKMMGLKDEGQAQYAFNYIASDPGQIALQAARDAGDLTQFRQTVGTVEAFTFSGYVLTAEVSAGVDEAVGLASNIEVSGSVTRATATA